MTRMEELRDYCSRLRLSHIPAHLAALSLAAQERGDTYADFLADALKVEYDLREENTRRDRIKASRIAARHNLDEYDFRHSAGLSERQLKELRTLAWVKDTFNLILMGPSGTGKTFIASGLIYDAILTGRKGYLLTMEEIVTCLRTKDISLTAMRTYTRIMNADILAIDDIMLFPIKKEDSSAFFNLINSLHEKASLIITTNKSPTEWARTLGDDALASALLDRLLFRCEVVKLSGTSYRMENRKTIFNKKSTKHDPDSQTLPD